MNNTHTDAVLKELQQFITIFLDQLTAERELLLTGDANDLGSVTAQKQDTLTKLQELESRFTLEFNQLSHKDQPLPAPWVNIIEQLKRCQQMNSENSALVNQRLKQTGNTLHQLHGLLDNNHSATYDEAGCQKLTSGHNRSVRA